MQHHDQPEEVYDLQFLVPHPGKSGQKPKGGNWGGGPRGLLTQDQ